MKNKVSKVLIIPGIKCPDTDTANWYFWMKTQLIKFSEEQKNDEQFEVILPKQMPDPYGAKKSLWLPYIKDVLKADENTILIGHSSGSMAAIRLLEEMKLYGVVLVCPCYTDLGDKVEKESGYYDTPYDWETMQQNANFILQYSSTNDKYIPIEESRYVKEHLKTEYYERKKNHFFKEKDVEEILEKLKEKINLSKQQQIIYLQQLKMNNLMMLKFLFLLNIISLGKQGVFHINIQEPQILAKHFKKGFQYLEIIPGIYRDKYSKQIQLFSLNQNTLGCNKYNDFFVPEEGKQSGLILIDSDKCSLGTKIHYAQQAGIKVLFLKYVDDSIHEADVDVSSFQGVNIPVFMLKNSDVEYISDVLRSNQKQKIFLELIHDPEIDHSKNIIQIYMNSQPYNNPMIYFLKDLKEHSKLFDKYQIDINYSLGFCQSCKLKNFKKKEPSCLSGGRYCIISSEFHNSDPVIETLRQICIKKNYGINILINYIINYSEEVKNIMKDIKDYAPIYECQNNIMKYFNIDINIIEDCIQKSFVQEGNLQVNYDLNDNLILKEEQEKFFQITKYNIFPLIKINNIYYDRSINIRDFISFGCENELFDCRSFKIFKKFFVFFLILFAMVTIWIFMFICKRLMKRKMQYELDQRVQSAVEKYLKENPSELSSNQNQFLYLNSLNFYLNKFLKKRIFILQMISNERTLKQSKKIEKNNEHIIQEIKRLVNYYFVIVTKNFQKLHFDLNLKLQNTSNYYTEVFSILMRKFFDIKKVIFVKEEKQNHLIYWKDFEQNCQKKIEQSIYTQSKFNEFLLNFSSNQEFKKIDKKNLDSIEFLTTNKNSYFIGLKLQEYFETNEKYIHVLIELDKDNNFDFCSQKINFLNTQKLLQIFLDICYLDQFYNMFMFKNLHTLIYDFFSCFFQNIDNILLLRIFKFLQKEENLNFSNDKKLLKNDQSIIYKFSDHKGLKIHKKSQSNFHSLKNLFKELKTTSYLMISIKQHLVEQNKILNLYGENTKQIILSFNENGILMYSNKLPKNIVSQILCTQKISKNLHYREIFQSNELIQQTENIIKTLIRTKRIQANMDSSDIHYEIQFDFVTKEYKGFTMFIDKQTYINVETNNDTLPRCLQHIFMGNRYQEAKLIRRKKKKPFKENMQINHTQNNIGTMIQKCQIQKDFEIQEQDEEQNSYSSINSKQKQQNNLLLISSNQKNLFSPLLERSPSYFMPRNQPNQISQDFENTSEKHYGLETLVKSINNKKKSDNNDSINYQEISDVFKCQVSLQTAIEQKNKLEMKIDFFDDWNFNVLNENDQHVQGATLLVFNHSLEQLNICQKNFYEFMKEVYYFYQRNSNPFHNYRHGVMVLYSTNYLVNLIPLLRDNFDIHFKFAFLLSAYCHDLDHPGTNNNLEIQSLSKLAIRYSDQSPLEYHHLYQLFNLIMKEQYDFLGNIEREKFKKIRELMIEVIVATDMKFHFHHLENSKKLKDNLDINDFETFKSISGLILHTTDLSHTAKTSDIAESWARAVSIEFSDIYEQEQEMNLPVTPFFKDLEIDSVFYKSEMNFMKFIINPLYKTLCSIFEDSNGEDENKILQSIANQVDKNQNYYSQKFEESSENQEENQIIQNQVF